MEYGKFLKIKKIGIHIKYDDLKKIPENFFKKIKFYDSNDAISWK